MKRLYLSFLLGCLAIVSQAQTASTYAFSQVSGTYSSQGGTTLFSLWDDNTTGAEAVPIGFPFWFTGTYYSGLGACSNGWVNFGTTAPANTYTPLSSASQPRIAAFAEDLYYPGPGTPNTVTYTTTGTAPTRRFTMQWNNACHWSASNTGPYNFQINLYESSNVVEVVYGNFSGIVSTTTYGAQVGITGPTNASFNNRTTTSNWSATTAGTSTSSTCSHNNTIIPGNGLTFRWTPPPTITVSPATMPAFVTGVSTTSSSQTFTLQAFGLTSGSVTVTAPANFEIFNGTAWVTSMTVATSSAAVGTYINTPIQVRFIAPGTTGSFTGNITCSSTGATTQNVAVTGNSTLPCSGTPTPGTASASPSGGSSATSFTLSTTGYTIAGGITFQWQSAPSASGPWTNVTGATNPTYTFSGLTATTHYRCNVTCASNTATTNSTPVTFIPSPTCIPTSASWVSAANVSFGCNTFNITGHAGSTLADAGMTAASSTSTGYLSRFAITPVNLMQGGVYPGTTTRSSTTNYQYQCIWIDFNDNGTFEPSEAVTPVGGSSPLTATIANPFSFNITIPNGANTGIHLMRLRGIWESTGTTTGVVPAAVHPCNLNNGSNPSYFSGNVVDYYVNILPMPPTLFRTPTSLTFATTTAGTSSTALTFSLNGLNLATPPGNVTVTAPAEYEVSADGSTWFPSINIPYTTGTLAATTVYVRFNAPVTTGTYTGNIVISGGGATSVNVAVSGLSAPLCSGAPTAGTAAATPTSGAGITPFTLNLTGFSLSGGLSFQWQSAPSTSGPWTNITGATNTSYSFTGVTTTTYYRCNVSCGASTSSSSTATITFMPLPVCTPTAASWSSVTNVSYGINTFNITGFSGSNLADAGMTAATSTATGYLSRLALTPINLQQGGIYPATTTRGTTTSYQYQTVWIDFNDNGTFENSEMVTPVAGSSPLSSTIVSPLAFNLTIPFAANPGIHLMRIRGIWESIATSTGAVPALLHPCNINNGANPSYFSGNVVDYYVNIVPLPACSGVPTTGTVNASASSNCTTFTSNLSLSLGATGQTYQWQSSPDNTTWTNLSGATNPTYTATVSATTYYRCAVTCVASGLSANSPSRMLSILPCILMPSSGTGSSTVCGGLFYDNGGPAGNYACCSITGTYTFYPATPGKKVQLVFNYLTVETCCDYMRFYNGSSTAAPQIGGNYNSNPGTITSTAADGSLTVTFWSDVSAVFSGWEATINLVGTASNPITSQPVALTSACQLGSVAPLAVSATGSTFTYQWYNNGTTNSNTGGTLIAGATNSTYAPSTAAVGNTYYYCVVRDVCGNTTPSNTAQVVVSPPPPAITGLNEVCQTRTITLNNPVTVGTWTSSNTSVATVTGASGTATVTGGAAGNAVISYFTSPACFVTQAITVNATPVPITGTLMVCESATTSLTHPDGGTGTWSSTNTAAATIGLTSGIATGVTNGLTTISYTNVKGCVTTRELTVNPLPVVTVTPSADTVCPGNSSVFTATSPAPQMNLLTQDFNTALGAWSVTNGSGVPAANGWSIVTPPGDVSVLGDGSSFLQANAQTYFPNTVTTLTSPSFSTTGGFGNVTLTFNQTLLSFAPDLSAKVEFSVNNGPWTTLAEQIVSSPAIINDGGTWAAANPQFTMDLPAAAVGQPNVRLRWVYDAQTLYWTIDNISVKGTMPASSFTWSGVAGLSCTNCATTTISPLSMGTNLYNVAATTSAGCVTNTPVVVTVETPAVVTGAATVCEDATTIFSNATPYGSWSSANTAIATVDATSGEIYGVSAGLTTITYALPSGCFSVKNIQVIAAPVASGPSAVCQGNPAIFSGSTPGAVWSSSAPAIAAINSSGIVTTNTMVSGALNIYYTSPSTGCIRTLPFTVNAVPAITGTASACEGSTSTLSTAVPGGTWTSANSLVASVDAMTGVVTGVNALNTMISYTTPAGCVSRRNFVVNPLPFAINGSNTVCESSATAVSNATPGGIWTSSDVSVVTVNSLGEVTPMTSAGNAFITYTVLSTGCYRTTTMTVNPLPSIIAGGTTVCAGNGTTMLSSFPGGGTWASSNPVLASIDVTTGLLTGHISGAITVTYTLPTGCLRTQATVVNPQPNSITGTASVCEGFTSDLNNSTPGGTWSTSDAGIASVDAATGLVTGNVAGTALLSYTLGSGCSRVRTVTVNTTPAAFTGVLNTCPGQSSMLSSFPSGGGWTSAVSSIATVNSIGNVTGVAQGNVNISYTLPNGCRRVENFVVNPLPAVITGTRKVCIGEATQLFNTTTGGTWATTSTNADVDLMSGIITGNTAGTLPVTYTLPTGCFRATTVTVNSLPEAIAGPSVVCEGSTITLTNPSNGGTWNSANASIATIGATSGMLTGVADGIVNVSYTLPTGCRSTMAVQVNGRPGVINGLSVICKDQQTALTSTPGGVWSSSDLGVVSVDAAGMMTGMGAGNAEVRYTLPTGCFRSHMVSVNPLPAAIVGNISLCQGGATGLYSATPGGTWSSSNPAVAPVSPVGLVQGAGVGFSIISYTLPTGCARTATMVVNGLPEPITGVGVVCSGNTTQLESVTPGGIWSTNNDVVSISTSGLALGVGAGTSIVSYTNNVGCRRTKVVTVNALPDLITGSETICPGTTATLGNSVAGGTWMSDNTAMLTINATTGAINAVGADGTANVTYTLPTGCIRATQITVHPAVAPVTGTTTICREGTTTLSNATVGGTWMSGNDAIATVDETTGVVMGVGAGVTSIAYVMPTGCKSVATLIVNGLPANITGAASVCAGSTAMLENAVPGGSWSVANAAIATVDAAGNVTGVAAGETQVVYTLPTGCTTSRGMVVNALPMVQDVTGGGGYCAGGAGVAVGIDTTENNMLYKLMDGTSTLLTMIGNGGALSFGNQTAAGTYSVTAVSLLGCMQAMNGTATVVVNPILTPTVNVVSDNGTSVCAGTSVTYSVSSANGGTTPGYVWKVNGTEVGTAATYSYIPANGDEVSVKLTSSEACAVPSQVGALLTMTVLPVRTPSVSIVVGPDDTLCQGGVGIFRASAVNGGVSPVYTWQVNGAIVAGATNDIYTYEPTDNDVVVCRLTSTYACVSANDVASNSITMQVDEIYTPIVEMTANPGIAVNAGTTVTFTANPIKAGTAPTFQWLVNDKVIAGATQNTYTTANLSDRDSVTCVVTATDKCSNRSINSIVMTVMTPTGVSTATLGKSELRLIPNPNAGSFVVTGTLGVKTDEVVMFEVVDMLGQVVYRGSSKAQGGMVDARVDLGQNLANGMYMLNLTAGGDQRSFHFVLKH